MGWPRRTAEWLGLAEPQQRGADPTLPWGSSYIPTNGQTGMSAAGIQLNEDQALSITAVYTAVSILTDSISTLPLLEYKAGNRQAGPVKSSILTSDPWPEGTLQDFLAQIVVSLTLRGNFFGIIVDRDPNGYASMVKPIHPDTVLARRGQDGKRTYFVDGRRVDSADVVHIPNLLMPGSFIGLNPVEYMRQSWGLAAASERYMGQFYANSATPTGVIEVGEDLTEEETLELARAWKMSHGGINGAGLPAVLTGGATWKTIQVTPGDAQFLQTRDFQRQEIAAFFRIPSHLMGQVDRTSSWGTGVAAMEQGFVINTLRPYLAKIEAYVTRLLPPNREARFDISGRLRGDMTELMSGLTLAVNNGWMNLDEARFILDMPPLPGGDGQKFWRPLNFGPVDMIIDGSLKPAGSGGIGGGIDQSPDAPAPGQPVKPPNNPAVTDGAA